MMAGFCFILLLFAEGQNSVPDPKWLQDIQEIAKQGTGSEKRRAAWERVQPAA